MWKNVPGFFSEQDATIYERWAYDVPDKENIVEIGVFKGRSTCCLLHYLDVYKKHGVQVWGLDLFPKDYLVNAAVVTHLARHRCHLCCLDAVTHGHRLFEDMSVWAVYIDAEHTYEQTRDLITLWLPKIKLGGWIGGHDYCKDWPGVIKAVDDMFGKTVQLFGTSWGVQVV